MELILCNCYNSSFFVVLEMHGFNKILYYDWIRWNSGAVLCGYVVDDLVRKQ